MTTRHRKASRPLTPLSSMTPATRRGLAVAASSGLALTMIASGANAASSAAVAESAGSLDASLGTITLEARTAVTTNAAISVSAAAQEVSSDAAVEVETAEQAAASAAEEQAESAQDAEGPAADDSTEAGSGSAAVAVANPSGSSIVGIALQYQGVPYVSGGADPSGWDCSGFVQYVYAQAGISLPRTTYAQAAAGTLVSAAEAQPGDIVYYGYHVGIYVGDGMMIDAGTPSTGTVYREIWGAPSGYVRIG
ncbi:MULTISPECIES: C40 family peptidase [unclassified Actinomyces]|uniref:C40 family peptidase n=1 Tax=unclassified Actinomyces TaxID=2609248 RepID=UPI002017B23E|nr:MULTISPECIES: C40 family peptidase [unclassified Actinomyces]MCL3778102.1 C40 family peptidase [Actinomyces sp. AC-20-1]MCL3789823.1 C40 family peptidase [Actinomyces sp. 187325]MCL3792433.1 C40 family peptidase [Actinomyces sp. 186855]MCL3794701.1 C40 family peptidase [Actinomyces sp. 217892]